MASYWQDMGLGKPTFKAKGMGDIRGARFGKRISWLETKLEVGGKLT